MRSPHARHGGRNLELYAAFSRSGATYTPFPDPHSHRIRPEDLPRVCEKGYTGAGGRADKKSTGIGLFLCKRILTRLGHGLSITSRVGVGTTARIELRAADIQFE